MERNIDYDRTFDIRHGHNFQHKLSVLKHDLKFVPAAVALNSLPTPALEFC